MQWKKVNKSGRSTPGAMVMVGAGHVSAQCQETQPLLSCVNPTLSSHCIALLSVRVTTSVLACMSLALYFPYIVMDCIAQCQSRNLFTRA